ncbi:hypothetical protein IE53DRAFT_388610 [Violaceomyces palustris]|uniref:Uncharacterized protein n=1 Tax=Violaceomyces palustris TaxID=1673888 RepID=A0ACD0NTR3_9BASI|nr:hypothetical protein IE53DRAFT_388610 [Violaceomyces palustris]
MSSTSKTATPAQASKDKSMVKDPNPTTDYKSRYLKCKEKFQRASTDQAEIQSNVQKASSKQQKLQEEIDFLLDAMAILRERRAQEREASLRVQSEIERERDTRFLYESRPPISRRVSPSPPPSQKRPRLASDSPLRTSVDDERARYGHYEVNEPLNKRQRM